MDGEAKKERTVIFNPKMCENVDLVVGNFIRIYPPWYNLYLTLFFFLKACQRLAWYSLSLFNVHPIIEVKASNSAQLFKIGWALCNCGVGLV